MPKILIAGGGITGLTAAYRLHHADPSLELAVLEPGPWGGKIRTDPIEGFLIEGGPDAFLSQKPWALELCRELGLETSLEPTLEGRRPTFIASRGRLVELPEGLLMMAPTRLGPFLRTPLLSWRGKLRAGLELFLPGRPRAGDESVSSFIQRRFGKELFERVAEPLLGGLYAGDAAELSLQSLLPQFAELERAHGSVTRALRARAALRPSPPSSRLSMFMTLKDGLGQLVQALLARLPAAALRRDRLVELRGQSGRWKARLAQGAELEADVVLLALPAYAAAEVLAPDRRELAEKLKAIPYASSATVSLAYRPMAAPRGYGFVVPKAEGRRLLACTWSSSKYPHRAPEGAVLLRGYLGGSDWTGQTDEALIRIVREELQDLMGLSGEPVLSRVYRWERAMPQYRVGHPGLLSELSSLAAEAPGLLLAGSAYRGVGVPDCVRSANQAAASALDLLKGRAAPRIV